MRFVVVLSCLFALAACESEKADVLKSPCVSLDETCGPKRNANPPWLQKSEVGNA